MGDCTIVSGFLNLGKYQKQKRSRDPSFYIDHASHLLSLPRPMILYIEPEYVNQVQESREKNCLQKEFVEQTHIIPFSLADSPYFKHKDQMDQNYQEGWLSYLDKNNDTPAYVTLTWTKLHFLQQACQSNPWKTEKISWIDFGIFYLSAVAKDPLTHLNHLQGTLDECSPDKITCLAIHGVHPPDVIDKNRFYRQWNARTAGGFICGGLDVLNKFFDLFTFEIEWCIQNNIFPLEEPIISVIRANHKDLFDPYYGDYEDILSGYHSYTCYGRMSYHLAFHQFKICENSCNWEELAIIAERVWEARKIFPRELWERILNTLLKAYNNLEDEPGMIKALTLQCNFLFPSSSKECVDAWVNISLALWYHQRGPTFHEEKITHWTCGLESFPNISDFNISTRLIQKYLDARAHPSASDLFRLLPPVAKTSPWYPVFQKYLVILGRNDALSGGLSCERLLLSKSYPPLYRTEAENFLLDYICPLEYVDKIDLSKLKLWTLPAIPDFPGKFYRPLNPNILPDPETGGYFVLCRTVNYYQDTITGAYTIHDPQNVICTRNFMLSLDADLNVVKVDEVLDVCSTVRKYPGFAQGFEDMRLTWKEGEIVFSATSIEVSPTSNPTMTMGKIDRSVDDEYRIHHYVPLEKPHPNRQEKNWIPLTTPLDTFETVYVIYCFDPFTILECHLPTGKTKCVTSEPQEYNFSDLRGSSGVLSWGKGYLTVTHQVIVYQRRRYYIHRFIYFEMDSKSLKPFIRKISRPFYFFEKDVEYCNGMCYDQKSPEKFLLLGVGVKDREAYLVRIGIDKINEMLYDLTLL